MLCQKCHLVQSVQRTDCELGGPGVRFLVTDRHVYFLQILSVYLRGPPSLLFNRYWDPFLGIKRSGRDSDHSPPPNVEVKNEWSYTSIPLICLCDIDRDKLAFTFLPIDNYVLGNTLYLVVTNGGHIETNMATLVKK